MKLLETKQILDIIDSIVLLDIIRGYQFNEVTNEVELVGYFIKLDNGITFLNNCN